MSKGKTISFTASDLARYHNGSMSGPERHALEKAALDDPFLAEALEGYALSPVPQAELTAIRTRLAAQEKRRRVVPMRWLSVAAGILVLGLGAWFTVRYTGTGKHEVALKQVDNTPPAPSTAMDSVTVSAAPAGDTVSIAPVAGTSSGNYYTTTQAAIPKDVPPPVSSYNRQSAPAVVAAQDATEQKDRFDTYKQAPLAEVTTAPVSQAFKKEMVADKPAMRAAPVMNQPGPSARNQALNSVYSNKNLSATFQAQQDSVVNLNIVLRPLPNDSIERLTVMTGRKTDSAQRYKYLNGMILSDSLRPEEGWAAYDRYLGTVIEGPEDPMELTKKQPHSVILLFDVDAKGQATNIRVEQSDCERCADSAIELLRKGPKWKSLKPGQTGRLIINF